MCYGCWEEDYDKAIIDTPEVREAARLIGAVYAQVGGGAGAGLHIVVDDWNLEDENLDYCRDRGLTATEQRCYDALRALPIEERAAAVAFYNGMWTVTDSGAAVPA